MHTHHTSRKGSSPQWGEVELVWWRVGEEGRRVGGKETNLTTAWLAYVYHTTIVPPASFC